jgi:hypothetical protein
MNNILITNAQGEKEPFSYEKVYRSAKRVGASDFQAHEIAATVQKNVFPGMKTWEIFGQVRELLEKSSEKAALRFSLKEAMRKLGPTGYSFEKYVGEIFEHIGYNVKLNQFIKGHCVTYEIDFVAEKNNFIYIGECKYHKLPEGKVDLQTALANCARFHDIAAAGKFGNRTPRSILVTNTKFTTEAIKYSECKHIDLLGWKYPLEQGLEYIIESKNLYPLTILPSYKGKLAEIFSRERKMLVKDIVGGEGKEYRSKPEFQKNGIDKAIREAEVLLNNQ